MILRLIPLIFLPLFVACVATGTTPRKPAAGFDPNQIAKSDIDRVAEAHQRELFASLRLLTEKLYRRNPREWRKGGQASLEAAVARIIHGLQTMGEREVAARQVGEMVMEELRRMDEVAYVRFASVYRSFQDVTGFQEEIRRLREMGDADSRRSQLPLLPEDP